MRILVFGLIVAWWPGEARQPSKQNFTRPEHRFGQLFHVKVQPPPSQDRALRGQHRVDHGVYDFSLLCADGIPLLMEDHKPRPCQPRPWLKEQKCPTGFWCHEGQTEHSFYCCPSSRKFANRCHLPPAVGYGKQRMRRFYFDWKTDACHELQYSGIGGNENSFMDYEQCEQVCRGAGEPPIMLPSNMKIMPPEVKEIKNPEKEKKLVYPKEVAAPVSLQPPPPPTTKPTVEEVYYTMPSKTTRTAPTTTTQSTTTQSTTKLSTTPSTTQTTMQATPEPEEIFDPNPCSLVPDKGSPGKMTTSMWYYDATSTTCSPFMYLGKGGNSNRFESSEECIETCGIGKPTRKSCELPPAIGNGPFNIPRFYFDKVTKKCERFFYSGKDGNDNRFYKKNKCERLCLRKKPKKKENIFEFTTIAPTTHESTPMRIIHNLVPSTSVPFPSVETQSQMHTDPYVLVTEAPVKINPITVEPWVEVVQPETTEAFQWHTATPHPTLIYEPRGETFPTMPPPSTTTPNIVDHVFNSLMNTQQQKLVELVQSPVPETSETPRKFSSHEKIPFGQVEQQPVPMTPYGSVPPTRNQYGMKVEPYQGTEYNVPQFPPSIYLPQVTSTSSVASASLVPSVPSLPSVSSVPSPTASSLPAPNLQNLSPDQLQNPNNIQVGPIPPYGSSSSNPYVVPLLQTAQPSVAPFEPAHLIPTLSPTAAPLPPTTIPPLPTLLPPNITYVTAAPIAPDASPCSRPMYGDATIMCETRPEICPIGTFCQIGQGQSICCPIMEEPPCEQAIEEGVGATLLRRWYFDPATRLCQPFHYKGFKGNQNNFQTFDSCNRACGATNICGAHPPQMSIHTHLLSCNSDADCEFGHSCIQSTPHNLCCVIAPQVAPATLAPLAPMVPTLIEQPNTLIDFSVPLPSNNLCEQPIDTGFGVMAEHRWGFTSGQCTSFLFAGQGGNMNNFLTRNDCVNTCQSPSAPAAPTLQCSQPAASGHGEQYLSRYFYSPEYRQCLHFIYSGEQGNHNNFESLQECLETCVANGVKFSSLANNPMSMVPPPPSPSQSQSPTFTFRPRNVCPQGDALITVDGTPIQCDPSKAAKCPGDHVCTPVGGEAYCCPSPMNFCLQNRPPISVCTGPNYEPVREIRFTYDPLADRCIRFSYQNCRGSAFTPPSSLNNFMSNSQCNRLCCNQGYNLVYKRRLLKAMVADDPMEEE